MGKKNVSLLKFNILSTLPKNWQSSTWHKFSWLPLGTPNPEGQTWRAFSGRRSKSLRIGANAPSEGGKGTLASRNSKGKGFSKEG